MEQFSRLIRQQPITARLRHTVRGAGAAALLTLASVVLAQAPAADTQPPTARAAVPEGYSSHQVVEVGGHISGQTGSPAMYSTLVNQQTGARILSESFEMRALPGSHHSFVDTLSALSGGFGGDPSSYARLNFSKGKLYDFGGLFRRDRQYFDYDLLANPNITTGRSIPIGPSNAPAATMAWPQVNQSPVLFNTVRRMTDTNLTLLPLSTFTVRAGYAQNIFQGPTLSPSYTIMKYDALLEQYQRNSTDDFTGAIDWKPAPATRVTFEEQITHYKADSYFTLNPNGFMVQEADGTKVSLGNWDSQTAYGISACNTGSMGSAYTNSTTYTILSPSNTPGGMPIINAACAVVSSYTRTQPTRIITPTEMLRFQSSAIKTLTMNGQVRYTRGNMNLPNYYENVQGLSGAVLSQTYSGGYANAKRQVFSVDYGVEWQASKAFTLADQVDYFNIQEPGVSDVPAPTTLSTPGAPNQTINYSGTLTPGTGALPHGINGVPVDNFFGHKMLTNNLTASWDATDRVRLALTYRYKTQTVAQGVPHNISIPFDVENDPINGTVDITENGGIFNAALRPASNWDVNGTLEIAYADNAFTSVSPRQTKRYRIHTKYRPLPWATLTAGYSDLERHNNTYNDQEAAVADPSTYIYYGPLNHVDYSRNFGAGAVLQPNEHYSLDLNYAYTDVFTATNICYTSGAAANLAGAATLNASGGPNICPGVFARGSTTVLVDWFARDFMDAPTQFGSVAVGLVPAKSFKADLGYTVSSVNGTQFFTDARAVNGSLTSTYQTPFVKLAWTLRPGLTWKAEYNFYGYGEGGPSGAEYCSTSTSLTATVVPCASMTLPTGQNSSPAGFTAPRNFHANNVTLAMRYEF